MESMGGVNWNMIKAIIGIMSFAMTIIGVGIVLLTRWIFITKKEFQTFCEKNGKEINNKLYDKKGITIFMPREECEKGRADVKTLTATIVPREEWEKSKAYRERRMDENQRIVCGKIDKINKSVIDMRKEQGDTNELLSALRGSFETYLELTKKELK